MSTGMQRFYDLEGEYVTIDELMDWVRAHPLKSGRILPIIIWGGFGIGKCVRGDTSVWVNGAQEKIQNLWGNNSGKIRPDGDGGEWRDAAGDIFVPSIDKNGKIVQGRVTYIYRQRVREMGRCVKLDDGSQITMTKKHRLLGVDGWTKDIEIGDEIGTLKSERVYYANVLSVEEVFLDEYVYDLEVKEYHNYVAEGMLCHNTQSIKSYAKERGLEMRTYHPAHDVNGSDIVGQSYHDEESHETRYALPAWLPTDKDPPGVLFIDELNRAPEEVLAGLMEPLGEGTIAQSDWELPPGWNIIAAANPSEMGYMVQDLDEAMVDRMVHYAPGWDAKHWGAWAKSAGLSGEIIDFALRHQGGLVSTGESQLPLEIENKLRTTPRTLEYMDALYEPGMPSGLLRVCSQGLMGRDASEVFRAMLQSEKPLAPEQIFADPIQDSDGRARYLYEDAVRLWAEGGTGSAGEELIRASSEAAIVALLEAPPVSMDPAEEKRASYFGRYLALLPPYLRAQALDSLKRSAPGWVEIVSLAVEKWSEVLARLQ